MEKIKQGVYIPPFKLAQLRKEPSDKSSEEYQKLMWELLRKSLNGIINKVNISNLPNVIYELFNENLLIGRGLLTKALIKGQLAAPNYTHVYSALISVINSKLPEVGKLILHRVISNFQKAYKRNDKLMCIGSLKFIAHLFNQQVIHELLPLQIVSLLLEKATEDSIEIACDFVIECGQMLTEVIPLGINTIFERFRSILQEGQISKRVQYTIENLMSIRKSKFKDHPGVMQELDLVEDTDKIVHEISLDDILDTQDKYNLFSFDPDYEAHEKEWNDIKKEILGDDQSESEEIVEEQEEIERIKDFTDADLTNLKKTIYLSVMSSVDFEECANKMLKLKIRPGQEPDVANMLIECCMHERTYLRFYGLLAQRFCILNPEYQGFFELNFSIYYTTIDRYETNKLRNTAKFFAHLLFTDAISWSVLKAIKLTEESTTSSSRIFIKILMQEIAENISIENMIRRFNDKDLKDCFGGLFIKDTPKNIRFCINFFTSIGLGGLTDDLRDYLEKFPEKVYQSSSESSSDSESSHHSQIEKNLQAAQKLMEEELDQKRSKKRRRFRSRS
jgi:pre-mRNA-splicing factor CWC22